MNDAIKQSPPTKERVVAIKQDGARVIARLDYKPDAIFRAIDSLHWLNDDDKFIDVPFNPVVGWEPLVDGVDGNPKCCELCGTPIPERVSSVCRRCLDLRDLLLPLMRNETARANLLSQFLDKDTADAIVDMHGLIEVFGCGPRTNPRRKAWRKLVGLAKKVAGRKT